MKSDLPKPLHQACGRSLLGWVVSALNPTQFTSVCVVVGHGRDLVIETLAHEFSDGSPEFVYAEQLAQRGTGDAAAVGLSELDLVAPAWSDDDHVIVLPGDTPLLSPETVDDLIEEHIASDAAATLVTARVPDPTGYGRIVRGSGGGIDAIVEHRDATADQLAIDEINGGMYVFRRTLLSPALRMIESNNAQGELYLTDVVGVLSEAGHRVAPYNVDPTEIAGVNDRAQLAAAAAVLQEAIHDDWMRQGVTVVQPSSTTIEAGVVLAADVVIEPGSHLRGATVVAEGSRIGPNTVLENAKIDGAHVPSSVVVDAHVAAGAHVAPFTHLVGEGSATA